MSAGDPARPRRVAQLLVVALLLAGSSRSARAQDGPAAMLPLLLERPSDGSSATLAAGPAALHVVFFATWCSPCLEEFRALADLESHWASRGYRLVLVAVPSRQTRERVASFVAETRPPGEVLFDATGEASRALGVDHLPAHVLIDRQGAIVHRGGGVADGVRPAVEALLTRRTGAPDPRR